MVWGPVRHTRCHILRIICYRRRHAACHRRPPTIVMFCCEFVRSVVNFIMFWEPFGINFDIVWKQKRDVLQSGCGGSKKHRFQVDPYAHSDGFCIK